jgi:hypothetical protein
MLSLSSSRFLFCFCRCPLAFDIAQAAFSFLRLVVLFSHKSLYIRSRLRFRVTMIIGRRRFNIYLFSLLAAALCGCHTTERDKAKQISTFRVHLETVTDANDFSTTVPIYREKPVMVTVDKDSFLTEANVSDARILEDSAGGFKIQIQLDRRGTWLLEEKTTTNPGKHFAIFSEFGPGKRKQGRWLGAPIIPKRISSGVLVFTPDATREEADEIVLGLNNLAKQVNARSKW